MTRSPSLRTRVAVAATLGATVVAVLIAVVAVLVVARDPIAQLDDRLTSVARLVAVSGAPADPVGVEITIRGVPTGGGPLLPVTPAPATVVVDGVGYRVVTVGPATVGTPVAPTLELVARRRRLILLLCGGAVALAAGLGWLFAGRAGRPLRRLAERTHTLDPDRPGVVEAAGARESEEIADALRGLLSRTDIDVLREHSDLPGHAAVLEDIARAQDRLEASPAGGLRVTLGLGNPPGPGGEV